MGNKSTKLGCVGQVVRKTSETTLIGAKPMLLVVVLVICWRVDAHVGPGRPECWQLGLQLGHRRWHRETIHRINDSEAPADFS